MSHYTAGPWLISETGPKYSINAGNGGASTRHIAMVSCFQQYEGDSKENIANAKLIAAAPDLLEALEATIYVLELHHCADCKCSVCKNAKAAIAKAKGD